MRLIMQKDRPPRFISDLGKSEKQRLISSINGKVVKLEDKVAYFGMVLVQGALLPSHFSGQFPHWTLPFFLVIGLCCYQYRAYVQKDVVYTIGNMTGIFLNGSMLIRIIFFS